MSAMICIAKVLAEESFRPTNHSGQGMMEDYEGAFLQRVLDVEALNRAGRRTAAMHFGGVAIECYLKYLIFTSLPESAKREWKTETNDPGHTIHNPGHSYKNALRSYKKLWSRVLRTPHVLKWFQEIENPEGHFIDIRYVAKEVDDMKYKQWWKAYQSLMRWLQENGSKG